MPVKEMVKTVKKVWGQEDWIVNCDEYCGKFLRLNKGATSSYHYHRIKKETFYCINGQVVLTVNGRDYMLNQFSRPKTILPGQTHKFRGITSAVILEISSHHNDNDVVRITESEAGSENIVSSA